MKTDDYKNSSKYYKFFSDSDLMTKKVSPAEIEKLIKLENSDKFTNSLESFLKTQPPVHDDSKFDISAIKKLKRISSLKNFDMYLEKLINACREQDEGKINLIFYEIECDLNEKRKTGSISIERKKEQWNDYRLHLDRVKNEEVIDLNAEYNDNLELFLLANTIKYASGINKFFTKMEKNLSDIRKRSSIRTERNKKSWDDYMLHIERVKDEDVMDLRAEFDDNLKLFLLSNSVAYESGMRSMFSKMWKNLTDIRKRSNIRTERNKESWDDYNEHILRVQQEESIDIAKEIRDLKKLYMIAEDASYTDGMDLIAGKLILLESKTNNDVSYLEASDKFYK